MEKYTIPQIVEQRICIAPMTKEEFEIFKPKVVEYFGKDEPELTWLVYEKNNFYRIYPGKHSKMGCMYENYLYSFDEIKAFKTIQFSQIDFEEEEKQFDPNSFIGKKCKGFEFDSIEKSILWTEDYENYIGQIGTITNYTKDINSCIIVFENDYFYYPAELIHLHLVEEEDDFDKQILENKDKINEMFENTKTFLENIKNKEHEELDLTKLLVEGETYYSPAYGNVIFYCLSNVGSIVVDSASGKRYFFKNGNISIDGECMLFPSKEIRTWENYSPFKKGDLCLFSQKGINLRFVSNFYEKSNGKYFSGCFKLDSNKLEISDKWDFCERYDKSKFNF